jgi:hypothetical protein
MVSELATAICLPSSAHAGTDRHGARSEADAGDRHAERHLGQRDGLPADRCGKARALDALAQSEYFGAMPVPLEVYKRAGRTPVDPERRITRDQLVGAMGHLILPDDLIDHLGPAVSAGRSILMYGPPGNGKSSIANGIRDAMGDKVYIPRAIEPIAGQVITVYDPIVHSKAEEQTGRPQLAAPHRQPLRHALRPLRPAHGDHRGRADARHARPDLQPGQPHLPGAAAAEIHGRRVHRRRPWPPGGAAAGADQPLDRAAGGGLRHPRPAIGREVRGALRHAGDVLHQLPPNEIFDQAALRRIFFKIKIDGPNQENS